MQGKLIVILTTGVLVETDLTAPPSLEELQKAVGGPIELVPYFDKLVVETEIAGIDHDVHCVAFCHEEGKLEGLPVNERATASWIAARGRHPGDVLVGNVAVIIGDRHLLESI